LFFATATALSPSGTARSPGPLVRLANDIAKHNCAEMPPSRATADSAPNARMSNPVSGMVNPNGIEPNDGTQHVEPGQRDDEPSLLVETEREARIAMLQVDFATRCGEHNGEFAVV
jgi:hypothetical protein